MSYCASLCADIWQTAGTMQQLVTSSASPKRLSVTRCMRLSTRSSASCSPSWSRTRTMRTNGIRFERTSTIWIVCRRWAVSVCVYVRSHYVLYCPCLGCIDCTHVRVTPPSADEAAYVNRHHQHSINCQVVAGRYLQILDAFVNAPGATHDARILRWSPLYARWSAGWRPFHGKCLHLLM
jgi:hypothetical protein